MADRGLLSHANPRRSGHPLRSRHARRRRHSASIGRGRPGDAHTSGGADRSLGARIRPARGRTIPEGSERAEADELVDLLQTLFEEVVEDTRRRRDPYPEAEQVLDAAGRLFEALRRSLGDRSTT
jgi:hypothetical protein